LVTLTADVLNQETISSNRHTDWDDFRRLVSERATLNISLKIEKNFEAAAKLFNDVILCADWNAMPEHKRTELWGTASTSNTEILERFQSKFLHIIVDAP
jgi:hypothetical protein